MDGQRTAGEITRLPEDCIAHVLSLTTPRDACRSAAVSRVFRSAVETDAVWDRFLPADYEAVLTRAAEPVEFRSKKELYFRLCRGLLIDGCKRSFSLDKSTGKKWCMLSARDLRIVWGDTMRHWSWVFLSGSRFLEVAELLDVWWFEIGANLSLSMLTPETTYAAYLIYRMTPDGRGFDSPPPEASITLGSFTSKRVIRLQSEQLQQQDPTAWVPFRDPFRVGLLETVPVAAVLLGEFVLGDGCDGEVEIKLLEASGVWKTGLIVEGIEFRPTS